MCRASHEGKKMEISTEAKKDKASKENTRKIKNTHAEIQMGKLNEFRIKMEQIG